jgi:hypothetical protein
VLLTLIVIAPHRSSGHPPALRAYNTTMRRQLRSLKGLSSVRESHITAGSVVNGLASLGGTMIRQASQPNPPLSQPLSQHWNSLQLVCRQSSCVANIVETLQLSCRACSSALHVHNGLTADRRPKQLHYRCVHPAMCCNAQPMRPRSASCDLTLRWKATTVDYAVGDARLRCNAHTSRPQQSIR